mgnify:CR=1 FL=1
MRKHHSKKWSMVRYLLPVLFSFIFSATMFAQKMKISGTIVDTTGEPIFGASIMELGAQNGVVTDIDGKFTIDVETGKILRISYIGFIS